MEVPKLVVFNNADFVYKMLLVGSAYQSGLAKIHIKCQSTNHLEVYGTEYAFNSDTFNNTYKFRIIKILLQMVYTITAKKAYKNP